MDQDLDLLAAMRDGVEYRIPIKVRKAEIILRPLTIIETNHVASAVQTIFKRLSDEERNRITEHVIIAKETLKLASKIGEKVGLTDYLLDAMTNDEVQHLMKQYVSVCDKVNPALEVMKDEEVIQLIEDLKKNNSEKICLALIDLSFSELVSVCRKLILGDLPTDK
jgi:hypothetical protein